MKLTRRRRIVLELLGPGFLGAAGGGISRAIWLMVQGGFTAKGLDEGLMTLVMWPLVIPYAYAFAAIPSLAYAAVLEWSFARGLVPASRSTVGLSTLLGLAAGLSMVAGYGFSRSDTISIRICIPGIGLAVGFSLGLLIHGLSRPAHPD